jgi:hypothetical protein
MGGRKALFVNFNFQPPAMLKFLLFAKEVVLLKGFHPLKLSQ